MLARPLQTVAQAPCSTFAQGVAQGVLLALLLAGCRSAEVAPPACGPAGASRESAPVAVPGSASEAPGSMEPAPAGSGAAAQAAAAAQEPGSAGLSGAGNSAPATDESRWLRGQLAARYRGRWRGSEEDHDVTTTLSLEGGDPLEDRWSFYFLGSLFADLDGLSDPDQRLFGLNDTWDHALLGRVYDAYADYNPDGWVQRVRLGRQLDYDTPEQAWFDGAAVVAGDLTDERLELGLYGGVPVHAYESSPEGDLLGGAWLQVRPWKDGRARLDWMHVEDEYLVSDYEEDIAGISLWQGLGRAVRVEGGYTMLDGDDRDVRAAVTFVGAESDLVLRASFYELLETERAQAIETDPFFNSLQELYPYEQFRVMLSKGLGEWLILEGGVDLRRVDDAADEGQFNRDFDRTFVTASVIEGLPWELEAALSWDAYDSQGTDTRVLGADLTRDFGKRTVVSMGTYYGLYKYDLFLNQEREDVRTWYFRLQRELGERTRLDLGYEYEDDDLDDYHTVRVGTTWSF